MCKIAHAQYVCRHEEFIYHAMCGHYIMTCIPCWKTRDDLEKLLIYCIYRVIPCPDCRINHPETWNMRWPLPEEDEDDDEDMEDDDETDEEIDDETDEEDELNKEQFLAK